MAYVALIQLRRLLVFRELAVRDVRRAGSAHVGPTVQEVRRIRALSTTWLTSFLPVRFVGLGMSLFRRLDEHCDHNGASEYCANMVLPHRSRWLLEAVMLKEPQRWLAKPSIFTPCLNSSQSYVYMEHSRKLAPQRSRQSVAVHHQHQANLGIQFRLQLYIHHVLSSYLQTIRTLGQ